jgi:hypothetical protein
MKLNEFLTVILTKLGADTSKPEVQTILTNSALATVDVADVISAQLNGEFFTEASAKQNPRVRATIKAEILNGLDARTKELFTKYEFDDVSAGIVTAEAGTFEKYAKLIETVIAKEQQKAIAAGGTKDKLSLEVAKLNEQIVKERESSLSKIAEIEKMRKVDKVNWELDNVYSTFDYDLPTAKDISTISAKSIINAIAAKKGIKFEATDTGIKLMTNEGTEHFENNIPISPQDFIKKTLLENKLIKTAPTPKSSVVTSTSTNGYAKTPPQPINTGTFASAIDSLIEGSRPASI